MCSAWLFFVPNFPRRPVFPLNFGSECVQNLSASWLCSKPFCSWGRSSRRHQMTLKPGHFKGDQVESVQNFEAERERHHLMFYAFGHNLICKKFSCSIQLNTAAPSVFRQREVQRTLVCGWTRTFWCPQCSFLSTFEITRTLKAHLKSCSMVACVL